jgi:putative redox protein
MTSRSDRSVPQRRASRIPSWRTGWTVLTFNFRGTGASAGQFSPHGWLADVRAAIDRLVEEQPGGIYVAGFSLGGSLAICAAGDDTRVQGVAALGARADFHEWAADPRRFLEQARTFGVITDPGFPRDFGAWSRQLREVRPVTAAALIPPRPFLIVHGSEDEAVSLSDARVLADAAENQADFKIIVGAGHRLRHDPRAIALLLGWLHGQQPPNLRQ